MFTEIFHAGISILCEVYKNKLYTLFTFTRVSFATSSFCYYAGCVCGNKIPTRNIDVGENY